MEYKSISTVISTIKGIIENKENELSYNVDTGELCVELPRQKDTGEYNVIMYHLGTNMIAVRWFDTEIMGEVKLYLIPNPDTDSMYCMTVDLNDSLTAGAWDLVIEYIPVLTEEEYFQNSTVLDYSNVTLEDMIESVKFKDYVDNLLRSYENY